MMRRYKHVLTMSENTTMATYFVNHAYILREMLNAVNSKPDVVVCYIHLYRKYSIVISKEIVICIINNVCSKDETMIHIIGNDLSFVSSILSHLESKHELVLLSLLRFLKVAVRTIRNNCASSWLGHLKKNESLGRSILVILEFEFTESNEKLIETVIDLVKEMAETNLNQSADDVDNSNQPNLLEEIHVNGVYININDIIYKITIRCKQMVEWNREREKQINLELAYNWLSIMTIMKTKIALFYNELNLHGLIVECLFCVFHPYWEPEVLLSELTTKQPIIIDLISKYAYLLSYLEYNLSYRINHILMRIISSLKIDKISKRLKSDSDKFLDALKNDNELTMLLYDRAYSLSNPIAPLLNLQSSLPNLLRNLEDAWLNMVQRLTKFSIKGLVLLIEPFYPEKEYFLQLLVHKCILDENSVKKIEKKINKMKLLFEGNEEKPKK